MKIIFMGTPSYAKEILEEILNNPKMEVVAVYTQPDKPVGRKMILTPPPVKELAEKYNIPVFQPVKLRDTEVVKNLLSMAYDYIVVAAYGQILPKAILEHAPCINLHASILPAYRGASPIQQTLLSNDTKTGVTAMLMDVGLDTGAILKISEIDVSSTEMAEPLFDKLTKTATKLIIDVLENFANFAPINQDDTKATHCTKITKNDGLIDFLDAQNIYNKYRAFTPWPGIFLENGLKLKELALCETTSENRQGVILEIKENSIIVGCVKGSLEIFTLQAPSKKETDSTSYIRGKRLALADTLS
ncbi:MAG: methionyl-tRNA formyltransferase [Sulfurimonadaceae bacterium]|nr:methionyl-tRNA formyltransferase [Sulfurimonadaceae bacterium]